MTVSMFLAFLCTIGGVSALVPGGIPVRRLVSVHARAVNLLVATAKEERAPRISQHGAVGRRAALFGAGALAFSQHNAAWADSQPGRKVDTFEKVVCTERSQAGDSNSATLTKKCTQERFFPSQKRRSGRRWHPLFHPLLGTHANAKTRGCHSARTRLQVQLTVATMGTRADGYAPMRPAVALPVAAVDPPPPVAAFVPGGAALPPPPPPQDKHLGYGVSAPVGVGGAPDALAVELHRMRLSLGEISRERDALRSHVRLLHQQLADSAISTALTQRKPGRAAPLASSALRGGGGGSGSVASGAKPSLGKEAVKELNARLHGPPEKVSRQAHLRWLEAQHKAQSRVNKRLDKKLENKEALEARAPNSTTAAACSQACTHVRMCTCCHRACPGEREAAVPDGGGSAQATQ